MNVIEVTSLFAQAVESMELAWAKLKVERENRRLLACYIRSLRRCARLRDRLKYLLETGNL